MPVEAWAPLGLVVVAIITYLLAPVVKKWLEKDDPPAAVPAHEPAAGWVVRLYADLDQAREDLIAERAAHGETRGELTRCLVRRAQTEERLKAAHDDLRELRAVEREVEQLRQEIYRLRMRHE